MALTDSQKKEVSTWIDNGASLSEVQTKIKSDFGLSMTFMEVRFLVDDLDLELKSDPPKSEEDVGTTSESTAEAEAVREPESGISIEVDSIVTPGAVVSGSVTFSDGTNGNWQIDQLGRLGLSGVPEGYQPSTEDVQEFQTGLQSELAKKGMA